MKMAGRKRKLNRKSSSKKARRQAPTPADVPKKRGKRKKRGGGWDSGDAKAGRSRVPVFKDAGFAGIVVIDETKVFEGRNDDYAKVDFTIVTSNQPHHSVGSKRGQLFGMSLKEGMAVKLAKRFINAVKNTYIDDFDGEYQDEMLETIFPMPDIFPMSGEADGDAVKG